jgi:hypothetical protein
MKPGLRVLAAAGRRFWHQAEVVPNLGRSLREERYGHRDGCL